MSPSPSASRGSSITSRLSNLASMDAGRSVVTDLLGVARRRKGTILVVTLGVILGAYAALAYFTELYEAEARLLVMLGRENVEAPVTVTNGSVFTSGVQEEEVNSYIQLLSSRALIEETVDALGPEKFRFDPPPARTWFQSVKQTVKGVARRAKAAVDDVLIATDLKKRLSDRDKVVKMVKGSLKVTREGRSNVIQLTIRLPSADLARQTLDVLIVNYFKRHIALRRVPNIVDLFGEEASRYRADLESLQVQRGRVREQWGLSGVDAQRSETLRRLGQVQSSLDEQRSTLALRRAERDSLSATVAAMPGSIVSSEVSEPNPTADRLRSGLDDVRVQRIGALSRFQDDTPVIRSYDEQVEGIEALLKDLEGRRAGPATLVPNPARLAFEQRVAQVDAELVGLEASIRTKDAQVGSVQDELQRLNKGEEILRLMDLERSVLEQKFITNSTRREEARIEEGLNLQRVANVAVLSPPVTNPEPASPRKLVIMAAAIAAGVMLGIGLALLLEWSDDTIYDAQGLSRDAAFLGEFSLG